MPYDVESKILHGMVEDVRQTYEDMVDERTRGDEPNAPRITIVNDVDGDAIPYPEFSYSNRLWGRAEGDGQVSGCKCQGNCQQLKCPCAVIQAERTAKLRGMHSGGKREFAYTDLGKVKENRNTIIECGSGCACTKWCPNRVSIRYNFCYHAKHCSGYAKGANA